METRLLIAYGLIVLLVFAAVALAVHFGRVRDQRRRQLRGRYNRRRAEP